MLTIYIVSVTNIRNILHINNIQVNKNTYHALLYKKTARNQ